MDIGNDCNTIFKKIIYAILLQISEVNLFQLHLHISATLDKNNNFTALEMKSAEWKLGLPSFVTDVPRMRRSYDGKVHTAILWFNLEFSYYTWSRFIGNYLYIIFHNENIFFKYYICNYYLWKTMSTAMKKRRALIVATEPTWNSQIMTLIASH